MSNENTGTGETVVPPPSPESRRKIDEQMCVVRSLASVASALTQTDISLDEDLVQSRMTAIQTFERGISAELLDKLTLMQESGISPTLSNTDVIAEEVSKMFKEADLAYVRKIINSVIGDNHRTTPLREAFQGIVARYEGLLSYGDIVQMLQRQNSQVCVLIPGHMAHVALGENNDLVSLSDRNIDGKPAPIGGTVLMSFILNRQGLTNSTFNAVIFTREEKVTDNALEKIDPYFLEASPLDRDFAVPAQQVRVLSGKALYAPDFRTIDEHIYPEVSTYETGSFTGQLRPEEAVAVISLSRKAAILESSFAQSDLVSGQVNELYRKKAQDLLFDDIPEQWWQGDVAQGIQEFLWQIPITAYVREYTPPAKKDKGKTGSSWKDVIVKDYLDTYYVPLQKDGGQIGEYTSEAITQLLVGRAEEDIPHNPGGARTPKEIQERIKGRKLGILIAKDYYRKTLRLQIDDKLNS